MFDLYLKYIQWKRSVKYYLIGKLNKRQNMLYEIIKDIDNTFIGGGSVYKIYLMNAPINELGLDEYIDNYNGHTVDTTEMDLHHIYFMLVDKVTARYSLFSNVIVISHGRGTDKYLEVYRKNYQQKVDL